MARGDESGCLIRTVGVPVPESDPDPKDLVDPRLNPSAVSALDTLIEPLRRPSLEDLAAVAAAADARSAAEIADAPGLRHVLPVPIEGNSSGNSSSSSGVGSGVGSGAGSGL